MLFSEYESQAFNYFYNKYGRDHECDIVGMTMVDDTNCLIRFKVDDMMKVMIGHLEYKMYRKKMRPCISFNEKMREYRVVYTHTVCGEERLYAESFDDAKKKWEDEGIDAELFFIEDENGNQVVFD